MRCEESVTNALMQAVEVGMICFASARTWQVTSLAPKMFSIYILRVVTQKSTQIEKKLIVDGVEIGRLPKFDSNNTSLPTSSYCSSTAEMS